MLTRLLPVYPRNTVFPWKVGWLLVLTAAVLAPVSQAQTISLSGGSRTLTINSAVAGSEPAEVTDNVTVIDWDATALGATAKITVGTAVPTQAFSLFVTLDVTSGEGTSQGEKELTDGMADADILLDIPTGTPVGAGTLTYRGKATASQGNSVSQGDDVHTVTYTILAQ